MNTLQQRRFALSMTQQQVSERLKEVDPRMDTGMVSRFEKNACLPTPPVMDKLVEVLQASVLDLYDLEDIDLMSKALKRLIAKNKEEKLHGKQAG